MSERDQQKPSSQPVRVLRCDECEDLIADALDGTLSPADAAAFARHQGECASCAQMFKETQQGQGWMHYLAAEPEVPAGLMGKILARTAGPAAQEGIVPGMQLPATTTPAHLAGRSPRVPPMLLAARQLARNEFEPRLMMTVAMAFFSIALTLNLTGINLSQVRAADLQPSRLRATLTRQYYTTNEQLTRYYLNLRLVYEMEARVRELRRSTEAEPARPAPGSTPNNNPRQPVRDGSPSSTVPKGELPGGGRTGVQSEALLPASLVPSPGTRKASVRNEVFRALRSTTEDQAERSLV